MQIIMTKQFKTIHYLFISRGNQILLVLHVTGWKKDIVVFYIDTDHWEPGRKNNIMSSWRRSSSFYYRGPLLQGRIVLRLKFWMRRGWLESMVIFVGGEERMTPAVSQMSL